MKHRESVLDRKGYVGKGPGVGEALGYYRNNNGGADAVEVRQEQDRKQRRQAKNGQPLVYKLNMVTVNFDPDCLGAEKNVQGFT